MFFIISEQGGLLWEAAIIRVCSNPWPGNVFVRL